MTSFSIEIFFYESFILCRIHQTERLENIIEIFPLRPLMEEIQAIIPAKDAVDVLILAAVPNYRFGTFEFLGKSHPKRVEIPREFLSRGTAHPMSSGILSESKLMMQGLCSRGMTSSLAKIPFKLGIFRKSTHWRRSKLLRGLFTNFGFGLDPKAPLRGAARPWSLRDLASLSFTKSLRELGCR